MVDSDPAQGGEYTPLVGEREQDEHKVCGSSDLRCGVFLVSASHQVVRVRASERAASDLAATYGRR